MKIYEFDKLYERISFTKYHKEIENKIYDACYETLRSMKHSINHTMFFDAVKKYDQDNFLSIFSKYSKKFFESKLKQNLENQLSTIANEILKPNVQGSPYYYVRAKFADIDDLGLAHHDNAISLNKKQYLDKLVDNLVEGMGHVYYDNYSGESNRLDVITDYINYLEKKSSDGNFKEIERLLDNTKVVNQLTGTLIHEMVHIQQHIQQHKVGKYNTQYRSYLQKSKKHFDDAFAGGYSPDFYRIHVGSPQEIGSFIHNISLELINDLDLANAQDLEDIPYIEPDTFIYYVKDFLISRIGEPKTPKEIMIFKRYLKGVYLEVQEYIKNIKEQIKNRDSTIT